VPQVFIEQWKSKVKNEIKPETPGVKEPQGKNGT